MVKKSSIFLAALALVLPYVTLAAAWDLYVMMHLGGLVGFVPMAAPNSWWLTIPFFIGALVCLAYVWAVRRKEWKHPLLTPVSFRHLTGNLFIAQAFVLSHSMLAVVSVFYVKLYLKGFLGVYAMGAPNAWALSIPFSLSITVCLVMAWLFLRKKQRERPKGSCQTRYTAGSLFIALAFVLSHSMAAVIGGSYALIRGFLDWQGVLARRGTPPELAFLWAIPFGVGIALCLGMAKVLRK